MFGKLLAALYASLTRAMPRTAARARVRTKPVTKTPMLPRLPAAGSTSIT